MQVVTVLLHFHYKIEIFHKNCGKNLANLVIIEVIHSFQSLIIYRGMRIALRRVSVGLFFWYLARSVHMLASAFQLRDGYPEIRTGYPLMKNNPFSWILYSALVNLHKILCNHQ